MSFHDLPTSVGIREATAEEIPTSLASLSQGVRTSVSESVRADSILCDVFVANEDGTFSVNRASAILSGHFEGMPLVPGVVSKRLASKFLGSDLYGSTNLQKGRKVVWKTTFPGAIGPSAERLEFRLEDGAYVLKSQGKPVVSFEFGEHPETVFKERTNLSATNVRDTFIERIGGIPAWNPEEWVLQSAPFQFVTSGGGLDVSSDGKSLLLWGYFDVPEDFIFVDEHGAVRPEIVEESVAQIASMAYARSRDLPPVRIGHEHNPKAQVLTFKSSMAEKGRGSLVRKDRLSVAIEILAEEGRNVAFAYEAWNVGHTPVMSGIIEGTAIPLKLLKRMVG